MRIQFLKTFLLVLLAGFIVGEVSNDLSGVIKGLIKKVDSLEKCCSTKKIMPTAAGKTKLSPAKSCRWLRENSETIRSGMYWISLDVPTQVYCDMDTKYDGGGWTLIGRVNIRDGDIDSGFFDIFKELLSNALSDLSFTRVKNLLLGSTGLRQLQRYTNFTQIRFYCRKAHGRTLHIYTQENALGKCVVDLMTEKQLRTPQSCGSYGRFDDDTSYIGDTCNAWCDNSWMLGPKDTKMYDRPIAILYKHHFDVQQMECDDVFNWREYAGEWGFYVR